MDFSSWFRKEPNAFYDPVTGLETEESLQARQEINFEQRLDEDSQLASMKDTLGWKILEQHLQDRLAQLE